MPDERLGVIPPPQRLWASASTWAWVSYGLVMVAAVPHLIVQFWFNQSL